jgi:peptidoglycan/LPS O-acetylase OafA/YrhL
MGIAMSFAGRYLNHAGNTNQSSKIAPLAVATSYVPALDGLRAVAILGVLIFHAAPEVLPGGFTGVDVFFVLSGYLITSVILRDISVSDFSFKEFYLRRVQRLLPNAVLMVIVTIFLAQVVLLPSNAARVAHHGVWTIINLSNFYIWQHIGGYWGGSADSSPLLHTWSLAVEEQFYLVFPAILLLLLRTKRLLTFAVMLTTVSFILSVYGTYRYPVETFYMLPTRAWELLLGAVFAIFATQERGRTCLRRYISTPISSVLGWGGLVSILVAFFFSKANHFPGIISLAPTIGALAVLVSITSGRGGLTHLLASPACVRTGKLSYSLYLWHWPLIVIGGEYAELTGSSHVAWVLGAAAVSVPVAALAYQIVEQPLRTRSSWRALRLGILGGGFCVCSITALTLSGRSVVADPHDIFDQPAFTGTLYCVAGWNRDEIKKSERYHDVAFPPDQHLSRVWSSGGIVHSWGGGQPRIVVIGSSHALMYSKVIDDVCKSLGISVAFLSADSTPVFFSATVNNRFPSHQLAQEFDLARKKWIAEWNPSAIIVIDKWDGYGDNPSEFRKRFHAFLGEITPHASKVIVFTQVPVLRLGSNKNLREFVSWHFDATGSPPHITPDEKNAVRASLHQIMHSIANEFSNVQVLNLDVHFDKEKGVQYYSGRSFFYADNNHLSDAGAASVREEIVDAIAQSTGKWVQAEGTSNSR